MECIQKANVTIKNYGHVNNLRNDSSCPTFINISISSPFGIQITSYNLKEEKPVQKCFDLYKLTPNNLKVIFVDVNQTDYIITCTTDILLYDESIEILSIKFVSGKYILSAATISGMCSVIVCFTRHNKTYYNLANFWQFWFRIVFSTLPKIDALAIYAWKNNRSTPNNNQLLF